MVSDVMGVSVGTVLRGKYRIERTLGSGGMGEVLLATHLRLGQRVAIKMLHASGLEKPDVVERFAREARSAATLTSDHVVRILDVDETEDRVPFFVMEYLSGQDLEALVQREGPLAPTRAVDLLLDACEGLAEAHAAGIVHRDLKPANLFLTKRSNGTEIVKVLDFGISKTMPSPEASVSLTTTQTVMGSPVYMSPEQLRASRDVDGRTDIWSSGVVLYQLLTGTLPFSGTSATAVAACIAADEPASLRAVRSDVPAALEAAILRCLEKKAGARYASMTELADALAPFASSPARAEAVARAARTREESDSRVVVATGTAPTVAAPVAAKGRKTETLPEMQASDSAVVPGSSTESASVASVTPPASDEGVRPRPARRLVLLGTLALVAMTGIAVVTARSRHVESTTSATATAGSAIPSVATSTSTSATAKAAAGSASASVVTSAVPLTAVDAGRVRVRPPTVKVTPKSPLEVDIK